MSDNNEEMGSKALFITKDLEHDLREVVDMFASARVYESQIGSLFSSERMMDYILQVLDAHFEKVSREEREKSN